jgi:hypothetical protein
MVSVAPDPAPAVEATVHSARGRDGEPADASRQALAVFRLDEEVDVVVLKGEMKHPKIARARGRDRRSQDNGQSGAAK